MDKHSAVIDKVITLTSENFGPEPVFLIFPLLLT
ncbi:hypothetical protein ES708_09091 [subsurface metagenome]